MLAHKRLKILVADDNEINLKVIIGMLEFAGHEVDSANGGEAVIAALERKQYQLLVLDCMMPGMDGFQVARKVRAGDCSRCDPAIPILAVTALATEQDRKRCLNAGMTGFCSKPVQAKALFAWIDTQFNMHDPPDKQSFVPAKPSLSADGKKIPGLSERELIKHMSGMLIRDATEWQVLLRKMLDGKNHEGLAMLAHKIRGTADVLGFQDLSATAATLERSGKYGKDSETSIQVSRVVTSLQQVIKDVQEQI